MRQVHGLRWYASFTALIYPSVRSGAWRQLEPNPRLRMSHVDPRARLRGSKVGLFAPYGATQLPAPFSINVRQLAVSLGCSMQQSTMHSLICASEAYQLAS